MYQVTKNIDKTIAIKKYLSNDIPSWMPIKEKMLSLHFPSIKIFLDAIEQNMNIETQYNSSSDRDSHTGSSSIEETINIVRGVHRSDSSDNLKNNIINRLKLKGIVGSYYIENYHFDESDGELDIERFLSGESKCYLKKNYKYSETFFDLIINIAILDGVSISVFERNITNIIEAIVMAEKDGLKIRVIMTSISTNCSTKSDKRFCISMIAKNYDEHISIDKLLGIFHKSVFRRLMFRMRELVFDENQYSGYGKSCNDDEIISMNTEDEIEAEKIKDTYMKQVSFGSNNG